MNGSCKVLGQGNRCNDIVRRGQDKGDSKTGEETLVGGSEGRRGGGARRVVWGFEGGRIGEG